MVSRTIGRRQNEGGFSLIELHREASHLVLVEAASIVHDGERVPSKRRLGKDIDQGELQFPVA
jgi:hypothetical protein